MVTQLGFRSPDEDAAERVELGDTVSKPLSPITIPDDFPLERRNLMLAPAQILKVGRGPKRVVFDSIHVRCHW